MIRLTVISQHSYSLLCAQYSDWLADLDKAIDCKKQYNDSPDAVKQYDSPLLALQHEFKVWLKQLPIVGFNSGRYDLNLMQHHLLPLLYQDNEKL